MDNKPASLSMGVLFIAIGVILLAQQLRVGGLDFGRLWPLVLIVIGAGQLSAPVEPGQGRRGFGLVVLGTIMLLHTTRVLRLGDSWPLFIVAFGISMLMSRGKQSVRRGDDA
jgi:hypothetical protein